MDIENKSKPVRGTYFLEMEEGRNNKDTEQKQSNKGCSLAGESRG